MKCMLDKCKFFNKGYSYTIFRIIVGLLFLLHGVMKFTGGKAQGLMLAAAIIEIIVGIAIVIGFMARPLALLGALEMIVAYIMAHAGKALSPLANGGEAAILFFAAFLVIMTYGAGKWAVDK